MASNQTDTFQLVLEFEQHLGVTFTDKSLLLRALTHRSYLNEAPFIHADNERLEFLGDAILDLIVAELLYQRFPEQREGPLTAMRANLVRRETLAHFARQIKLGEHLFLGRGEEDSGGRERDATLCAAFEALIGAIHLDQGIATTGAFLLDFLEPELQELQTGSLDKDAKSSLQEWSQAEMSLTPRYFTVDSSGPDHAKEFTVEVRIGERVRGMGTGNSKQRAAQAAARVALENVYAGDETVPAQIELED